MVKYNFELKIKIVLEYSEKGYSSNYLCKKYNIKKRGAILYWVKLYQTYGYRRITLALKKQNQIINHKKSSA